MKRELLVSGIIGFLIGGVVVGVLVWFLAANAMNNNMTGMMQMIGMRQMMGQTTGQGMMDNIDRHFIEQMIPHQEDAITMAELALEKAQRPETKNLAEDIIQTQSAEIEKMRSWYQGWFGTAVPENTAVMGQHGMMGNPGMHMGMMGNASDLVRLEQAADFDKAFVEQMIPHHQMA
jgi:uncharacterized protein (DUF305 family)